MRSALLVAALLSVAGFAWTRATRSAVIVVQADARDTFTVTRGDIVARLPVVGELLPLRSTTVSSRLGGEACKIVFLAEDGAPVDEGDVLVRFDRAPFELAVETADIDVARHEGALEVRRHTLAYERAEATKAIDGAAFEVELAQLELRRFEAGEGPLESARLQSELSVARAELARHTRFVHELTPLLEQGFVQPAEIEQLTARRDEAVRVVDLAQQQADAFGKHILPARTKAMEVARERSVAALTQVRETRAAKVSEAESAFALAERDLAAARARLEDARSDLSGAVLRAPTAGMLVLTEEFRNGEKRKPRIGDSVWEGQTLAYLPDLSQFVVEARVREVDLHKVGPGVRGRARFDAYPGLELQASVRRVGVLAERTAPDIRGKSFGVLIDLEGADARLRPGMTAQIELVSGVARDVLLVPLHAVFEDAGEAWCWVQADGALERRTLELGLRDHHLVEVRSGLGVGEELVVDVLDPTRGGPRPGR